MAVRRKNNQAPGAATPSDPVAFQLDRLNRLVGLLAVKGEAQNEKIRVLSSAGFSNTEIAQMLGITSNAVNVALFRVRAKK